MELAPKTRITELVNTYEFLIDYLADYAPELHKLRNPVMRKTVGRFATVEMAASMAGVPLDQLLTDLQKVIHEETGEEVTILSESSGELDQDRLETLKGIIRDLHAGTPVETLKTRFADLVQDVSPTEISQMEQQLIAEGLPQEQVKELCDVHVAVFRESLEKQEKVETPPGHPIHTFQAENTALQRVADELRAIMDGLGDPPAVEKLETEKETLEALLDSLGEIEKHYLRKENQLFPFLEKYGVAGPSQVMWAIHDDVRAGLKEIRTALDTMDAGALGSKGPAIIQIIVDMIYKEENILFPMSMEILNVADWSKIYHGEEEIGFSLVVRDDEWTPPDATLLEAVPEEGVGMPSLLPLDTGLLSLDQLNLMLKHLPVDVSFVDENDEVRYYSDVPDRIFPRSPGVIGRKVQNCHPPDSMHIVNQILDAFRSGERDMAEFWIKMGDRFIHIRYFAVRDVEGIYRGCLEVSQDVTEVRRLEGERRLLQWEDQIS